VDAAELDLAHTTISPAKPGRVVSLSAAVGQFAQAGTALAMFVPDEIWITANFKETQLNAMRPRQPVTLVIDAYSGRTIHGRVASIQPGSGTAFSLLPPQNATGNYVKIVQRVPVKIMAIGAAITAVAMYDMTRLNSDSGFWFFAVSRIYLGFGLPLIFISITAASYDGNPREKTDMASALINAARNIGGSIGISLANNILAHCEQFHQSRLVELINGTTFQFQIAIKQATNYFIAHGSQATQAQQQAVPLINQQLQLQASYLAYIDVFWVLTLISAAAVPLALILRKVKLGSAAAAAH